VETCDDLIAQENDHLKTEVKKLELEVNKLKKQGKVQHPQDNRSNAMKKLEKEKTAPNIASQPSKKQVQNEKDGKVEYARSVFLNASRPHIKSGIGYNNGDKHNSRVNTKGHEFIMLPRPMSNKRRSKVSRSLTMPLILILMLIIFLICHAMISMLLMCL
jgi:hypothetical protein